MPIASNVDVTFTLLLVSKLMFSSLSWSTFMGSSYASSPPPRAFSPPRGAILT